MTSPASGGQGPGEGPLLTRSETAVIVALSVLLAAGVAALKVREWRRDADGFRIERAQPAEAHYVMDLNTASWEELTLLPGIGESTAREIVAYRERVGGFKSVGQLRHIKGIGEKAFADIAPHVKVSAGEVEQGGGAAQRGRSPGTAK